MFCSHCGKEVAEKIKFCPYCGGKLDFINRTADSAAPPSQPKAASYVEANITSGSGIIRKRRNPAIFILIGALAAAVIIGAVFGVKAIFSGKKTVFSEYISYIGKDCTALPAKFETKSYYDYMCGMYSDFENDEYFEVAWSSPQYAYADVTIKGVSGTICYQFNAETDYVQNYVSMLESGTDFGEITDNMYWVNTTGTSSAKDALEVLENAYGDYELKSEYEIDGEEAISYYWSAAEKGLAVELTVGTDGADSGWVAEWHTPPEVEENFEDLCDRIINKIDTAFKTKSTTRSTEAIEDLWDDCCFSHDFFGTIDYVEEDLIDMEDLKIEVTDVNRVPNRLANRLAYDLIFSSSDIAANYSSVLLSTLKDLYLVDVDVDYDDGYSGSVKAQCAVGYFDLENEMQKLYDAVNEAVSSRDENILPLFGGFDIDNGKVVPYYENYDDLESEIKEDLEEGYDTLNDLKENCGYKDGWHMIYIGETDD